MGQGFVLDPQAMLVFAAIARASGVRGAAEALGIPRSTVSRRLADLERDVGAPLVIRTTRRFALTDLGAALFARCQTLETLLASADDLVARGKREPTGTLRVAVAPVLGEELLPQLLATFVRRYPLVSVDARFGVDYVDVRRDVDVALRIGPLEPAADVFAVKVGSSLTGIWGSPAYLAARGTPQTPDELVAHECIAVGNASPMRWTLRSGSSERKIEVRGRIRVDSFRVARALAAAGHGLVRTASVFAAPLVRTGELAPVLEAHWPRTTLFAVHAGSKPALPRVAAFIEIVREAVRGALPE